jgi:hypothetical protein
MRHRFRLFEQHLRRDPRREIGGDFDDSRQDAGEISLRRFERDARLESRERAVVEASRIRFVGISFIGSQRSVDAAGKRNPARTLR